MSSPACDDFRRASSGSACAPSTFIRPTRMLVFPKASNRRRAAGPEAKRSLTTGAGRRRILLRRAELRSNTASGRDGKTPPATVRSSSVGKRTLGKLRASLAREHLAMDFAHAIERIDLDRRFVV